MKKYLALILGILLLLCSTVYAEDVPYLDYHDYSQYPLVKDGEKVTITVGRVKDAQYGIDAEKTWLWTWFQKVTGIDMEFQEIRSDALSEQKTLMFASGNIPDVMIDYKFTADELVRYGTVEEQLLPLNDYINGDIMPNLWKWIELYPEIYNAIIADDGNIYTLPMFSGLIFANGVNSMNFNLKMPILEELGLEIPRTLNDFTDMLYKMKAAYPDSYPLGGAADTDSDPRAYFLNALGFLTTPTNYFGKDVAIKNGAAVIPAYHEDFLQYLSLLHQYYADGIMPVDFFTMDLVSANALMAENKTFTYHGAPYKVTPEVEEFQKWHSVYPLTSEYNDKPQWLGVNTITIGGVVLSAKTQNAELICRWLDFAYSDMGGTYIWGGPRAGSPDTLDMIQGFIIKDDGNVSYHPDNDGIASNSEYLKGVFGGTYCWGNRSHPMSLADQGAVTQQQFVVWEATGKVTPFVWDLTNGDHFFRSTMETSVKPYEIQGFPFIVYFKAEVTDSINELRSIIDSYIQTEVAKFITGARDLNEFENYRKELEGMGIKELEKYYADYYANYILNTSK